MRANKQYNYYKPYLSNISNKMKTKIVEKKNANIR